MAGKSHRTPACASGVITHFAQVLDAVMGWDSDARVSQMRNELMHPVAPAMARCRSTSAIEATRLWLVADFAVRVVVPFALRASARMPDCQDPARLGAVAAKLEKLPSVTLRNRAASRAACRAAGEADRLASGEVALAKEPASAVELFLEQLDGSDGLGVAFGRLQTAIGQACEASRQAAQETGEAEYADVANVRGLLERGCGLLGTMCAIDRA